MSIPWTEARRAQFKATMAKINARKQKLKKQGKHVSPLERKIAKAAQKHHAMNGNGHGLITMTLTLTSMRQVAAILAAAKTGKVELEFKR